MPQIQGYQDQVTAQGSIGGQASPMAFGAGVAAAVSNVAGAMDQAANQVHAIVDDQARIWAYDATSKAKVDLVKGFRDKVNGLDPQDPKFSEQVAALDSELDTQIADTSRQLMDTAPSGSAQKLVSRHMSQTREVLLHQAATEQSRISGEMTGIQMSDAEKRAQDEVAANPTNLNFEEVASRYHDFLSTIKSVDPTLKAKWAERFSHNLALTQVQVLASTDPHGFLATVHAQGGRVTPRGDVKGAVPGGPVEGEAVAAPVVSDPDAFLGMASHAVTKIRTATTVDSLWAPLIKQESGGKQSAVSPKGAVGVAQIMPSTGPEAAKLAGLPWDENKFRTDAEYNAKLGKAYLQKQIDTFGGDSSKALAAYNAGPGEVSRLIKKYGDDWLGHAPEETRKYVAAITAASGTVPAEAKAALPLQESPNPATLPQVQPLTDQDISGSQPDIAGWAKLTWPEKVAAVRQAEGVVGNQLAGDRGLMERDLKDAHATLMAGKLYPNLDDPKFSAANLTRIYGPVDGPRKFDQLQYERKVGAAISTINTMPLAQAESLIQGLEPQGGAEFADKQPVYDAFTRAVDNVQRMRNTDYMQWAQEAGVRNVQPLDFSSPDKFAASLRERVPVANAGITDYQANAHVLSKAEAAQMGDLLNKLNPQDQITYLKAIKTGTGQDERWFSDALAQIAPKNTMLSFSAEAAFRPGQVKTAGGNQNGDDVAKYILEGAHILQGKDLNDSDKVGRPLAVDDKQIRQDFWAAVGPDAFASPDAQRSSAAANDTYQAVKNYLVADIYHRGQDPKVITRSQVENAVKAVTGGTVKSPQGDNLFVPWGMEEKQFHRMFPVKLQDALRASGLAGGPMDAPDGFHYANLDEGRYLVMNGNRQPIVGKDGRPLTVDMRGVAHAAAPFSFRSMLPVLAPFGVQ